METFSQKKIGRCIAWGGEHIVYEYGTDQVIKFSLLDYFLNYRAALEKASFDIAACKRAFGEYMVPTAIVSKEDGRRLAKLQPKINGRPLVPHDLKDSDIAQQFLDIIERHARLVNDTKEEIDFMGGYGALVGRLTNMFLTTEKKVRIIDTLLISIPGSGFLEPVIALVRILVRLRQQAIMRRYAKSARTHGMC